MTRKPDRLENLSPECAVALQPGYADLHALCKQTRDIPLPHSNGILLVKRCACEHHWLSPQPPSQ